MALIICIEDNEDFREVVSDELERAGYTVMEAVSGSEGLELVYKHKPDLVVSDVMMPSMSGLELLIKMRASDHAVSKTPTILFSAATYQHYEAEAMKYGAFEYLLKPINWDKFLFSVKRAIATSEAA